MLASTYRTDIDGLRAVSVAAVVLYHAAIPGFGGGYVGVDVFFVISGYLITLLLIGSREQSPRRQLADFYLRRARRILPALCVVSLLAIPVALFVLLPLDLPRFGKYLAATPVFLNNLAARSEGGYFIAGLFPHMALNHFWSIAVEEQFYLLYPVLLLLIGRYLPRHRLSTLIGCAALSLGLCLWAVEHRPAVNYYLPPTRAWELLLGAIVALCAARELKNRALKELLAAVSLIVLALAFSLYDSSMRYPGAYTIAPCLATACLLAIGQSSTTAVGRLLSLRPLVFTGLISYSLYLWHFPIFAFFKYYSIDEPDAVIRWSLIAATYLLAAISWKVIEQPVRTRAFLKSNRAFVLAAASINAILLGFGLVLWNSQGFPARFSTEIQSVLELKNAYHPATTRCVSQPLDKVRSGELCRFGPSAGDLPKVIVWGDSHALALLPAYERLAWSRQVQLFVAATSACAPLLEVVNALRISSRQASCLRFNAAVTEAIGRLKPQLVILNAYWTINNDLVPSDNRTLPTGESPFRWGLDHTLRNIAADGRSVCVVADVPTLDYVVPYALAMARRREIAEDFIGISRAAATQQDDLIYGELSALQASGSITIVDPKDALCRTDTCVFQAGGVPFYRDSNHLSVAGAEFVSHVVEGCFERL